MRPFLPLLVLASALGAAEPATAADAGARGAPAEAAAAITVEVDVVTTTDGRRLVGGYDRAAGRMTLVDERSGRTAGALALPEEQVATVERRTLTVQVVAKVPRGADGRWTTDFTAALRLAQELRRPVVADFTGSDWCPWCVKLDREVFASPVFRRWAEANVVLVRLDFPRRTPLPAAQAKRNEEIAQRYGVTGYPTVLVLDAQGAQLRKWGYFEGGPAAWINGMITGVKGLEQLPPVVVEGAPTDR